MALPLGQVAAVQFGNTAGHVLQEAPIVGNEDDGAGEIGQLFFQPGDSRDVQVVGGLVQQQDVGLADQSLGQGHAAAPAS